MLKIITRVRSEFWVNEALCLCWFCKRSSSFLFVYVDLVNEALRFGLFMLNKAKNEAAFVFFSLFMVNDPISS